MTGFFIAIGLFRVVVIAAGIRYDRPQRRMGPESRRTKGRARLDIQTQADKWGGPGY